MIEAAALEGVVDLARAVGGDDDDGRLCGRDRAELGDRHLKVRQDLEEEGLERLVGPVELVDQEDRRALRRRVAGLPGSGRSMRKRGENTPPLATSPEASAWRIAIICAV